MKYLAIPVIFFCLAACSGKETEADAQGNFEADEVIVSAQQNGQLLSFTAKEGDTLAKGAIVGQIDVNGLTLQKEQTEATISALREKTTDPQPQLALVRKQLAIQEAQLKQLLHEQKRTENLVKEDAATPKQLDDMNASIDQMQKQILATRQQLTVSETNVANQNRSVLSEKGPLQKSLARYDDEIGKGVVANPVKGTVLARYALQGEMAVIGKALYKIADTDTLLLKAYITGTQLPAIKLGQHVKVLIDAGEKEYKSYPGVISYISSKSEFTPKTIQTKEERANLVYAIKVRVPNDGYLKIGMFALTQFH
ncbi:HlyD family secretion protein [Chitinophaga pinensis]|uniref:Secretion protein HlyD family protein n=1 Tax=Chitinophaga pinensis (strain ATCC 43595 / DSM 2588 / LMG 13176 / NBRC 15968 / NCIMB 11800 / UQM 2034) TaxID=485918 RepID=A0A979GW99_CHIPD|nr:HlyD family efflux transporter periplasmic adaptor subunit [Chitinophaga pinensis]ACU60395.1 secretion protein HlyD family protein [Chitinophaga pinensis DSM 2588]